MLYPQLKIYSYARCAFIAATVLTNDNNRVKRRMMLGDAIETLIFILLVDQKSLPDTIFFLRGTLRPCYMFNVLTSRFANELDNDESSVNDMDDSALRLSLRRLLFTG